MSILNKQSRNSFLKDYALQVKNEERTIIKRKRASKRLSEIKQKVVIHELENDNNSDSNSETNSARPPCKVLDNSTAKTLVTNNVNNAEEQSHEMININSVLVKNVTKMDNPATDLQINVPTNNRFKVLATDNNTEDNTEMDADQNNQEDQSREEQLQQSTRKPPPPIVIHGTTSKHAVLTKSIEQHTQDNYTIKYTRKNINIQFTDRIEREKYMDQLKKQNVDFHTYTDTADKTHAFVIRGLTDDVTPTEIAQDLMQNNNLPVRKCFKMTLRSQPGTTNTKALFLLVTSNSVTLKTLSTIRYALHTRIYFERRHNNRRITQCHNCQTWGHATSNCHAKVKCMFCAQAHNSKECPDKTKPKCANCEGQHQANDTKCKTYADKIEWMDSQRRPQQQNRPTHEYEYDEEDFPEAYKPAPPPATNAWKQRQEQSRQRTQQHPQTQQQQPRREQQQQQHHHQPTHTQQRQQQPRQPPATYTGSPPTTFAQQTESLQELTTQLNTLNELVNIGELIRALSDMNNILKTCHTKQEKFLAFTQFTQKLDNYDI